MRGLTLVVVTAEPARFRAALRFAAASAALGRPTRLFLDEEAVPAILEPTAQPLLRTAWELDVVVTLCQTGLATAGLDLRMLDPRLFAGGLVGLLGTQGEDELVVM